MTSVLESSSGFAKTCGYHLVRFRLTTPSGLNLQYTLLNRIFPSGSSRSGKQVVATIGYSSLSSILSNRRKRFERIGGDGLGGVGSHHLSLRRDKPEAEAKLIKSTACRGFWPDDL